MSPAVARPAHRHGERGAALLIVLFVLVVAWTATLLASISISVELRSARADHRRLRLVALSDSALAEALADLAADRYAAGRPWHPFAGGEIGSTIGDIDGFSRTVTARARIAGVERTVVANIVIGSWGPTVATWQALPLRPTAARAAPGE